MDELISVSIRADDLLLTKTHSQIFKSRAKEFRQEIEGNSSDPGTSPSRHDPEEPIKREIDSLNQRYEDLVNLIQSRLKENGEKIIVQEEEDGGGDSRPDIKVCLL